MLNHSSAWWSNVNRLVIINNLITDDVKDHLVGVNILSLTYNCV